MKKIELFVVDIDYPKEISSLTLPAIEQYANYIGAKFTRITERRFPKYPITYEKMQVYDLGKDNDWNLLLDCDMLIKEGMYNVIPLVPEGNYVGAWHCFSPKNLYNGRGIDVGIASNFLVVKKKCHDLFKPLDNNEHPEKWLDSMFNVDEFCISLNRQKLGYQLSGLELSHSYGRLFKHVNLNTDKVGLEAAVNEIKSFFDDKA